MSSNIKINTICQYCGNDFIAKTTVTRYCSMKCNRKTYKHKIMQGKLQGKEQRMFEIKAKPMIELKAKEFLLVRDAAVLLNSSRQTIYSLIKAGKIKAKNILKKKTLIPRIEIDKLFQQEPGVPLITLKKPKPLKVKDFYTIGEAEKVTGMSSKALHSLILKHNIPKFQKGAHVYIELILSIFVVLSFFAFHVL
ncbi:MAG: helix-turn-helix domain-containing protein [Candidatus Pedobacter colombiensis]|uniref:Helix-turn-helix domain-containing protein n=1 Tax=Candidatus Pedobacter colombiensis TaxID=3121371 RepID=A0AAJ6BAW5_9SPHI|nr:helix-turn-helix domain-containing protein [Pedobacter sp.]WEK21693.1 MAG: helix-turn-helix domain-containing protein [Pedobacter sp.]